MFSIELVERIQERQEKLLERCLEASQEISLPGERQPTIDALLDLILSSIRGDSDETRTALSGWANQLRMQGAELSALLRLIFVVRDVLRDQALAENGLQSATGGKELTAVVDQVVERVSSTYAHALQQTLTEHLQESEFLTVSLMQATEEADRTLLRLRSIYNISQALGTSLTDAGEVFERMVQELAAGLQAHLCVLWLSDVGPPHAAAAFTKDQSPVPELPESVDESAFGNVLMTGKGQVLTRNGALEAPDEQLLDSMGAYSILLAPLVVQEIPIGILTLARVQGNIQFDATEMTLVESVVAQAAVAVQNAGLYEEIRELNRSLESRVASRTRDLAREKERLETLYAIGRELGTTLDLDQVLGTALQLITRAVNCQYGAILTLDAEQDVLTRVAFVGDLSFALADRDALSLKGETGILGQTIERRESILIGDLDQDDRWSPLNGHATRARSLIVAPVVLGEDLYGVLVLTDDGPRSLDQDQQRLADAFAQQLAQAMSNAQMYHREQQDRSKTQAVLQSIADGVIVNDTQDKVIAFNAAAEEILDAKSSTVLEQTVWQLFDVFDEDGRRDALAALEAISSSPLASVGQAIETTLEIGNKIISAHMTPVVTENQQALGVVTALRDITREVEADRAKSEFVSTVSHELRTPLTSIKGYTDLIYGGAVGEVNDHQKRFLGIIKSNAERLTALINDLLDVSRIESGRVKLTMELHHLGEIISEVAVSLREEIDGKGLELEIDVQENLPEVMGDRIRLSQIVTNLISNAYKYTDEGWIRVSLRSLEGAVRLDVTDSGIGISTEDQSQIFEKFYRADTPVMEGRGGTGLGLAITKELVELHGGRMWVKSELEVGSTFTVVLPTAAQDLPPSILAELPAGAKKILVVDDERDILALLRHQLMMQGYHVVTASTGGQAITKAISEQPDLITLDILLPDRHGFDVLRELKAHPETAHIPVIVLSVVQDETNGYRLGAVDYIVKPLEEGRLLGSVSSILSRKGKILIAEDTPDTAELLIELLGRNGYQVIHAVNGYEALAMARREQPELILLDLRMPGMDGYEALTRLQKDPETRSIPILVMSAHAADPVQERIRLQSMGAKDFLSKPLSLEGLLDQVRLVSAAVDSSDTVMDVDESTDTASGTE